MHQMSLLVNCWDVLLVPRLVSYEFLEYSLVSNKFLSTVRQSNANGKNCTPIDDDEEGIFARVIWLFTERINREINEDGAISFFFPGKKLHYGDLFELRQNCERLARVPESSNGFPEVKWLRAYAYLNIVVHLSQFFKKANLGNRGKFIIRKSPVKWEWEKVISRLRS